MEGEGHPGNSEPHSHAEVHNPSLDEEALNASVHEMEEPLLGGVRSVMPDVTTDVRRLLVEILLTVPGSPLLLGYSESLAEAQTHVLGVSMLVVGKTSSYSQANLKC